MIQVSFYTLERGLPIRVSEHCTLRQPRIDDIDSVTYETYQHYLSVMLLQKEDLLKNLGVTDTAPFQDYSTYQIVASIPMLRSEMIEAFSFFMTSPMLWKNDWFYVGDYRITPQELIDMKSAVMQLSWIEQDEEEQHVFATPEARRIWEKCKKGRESLRKAKKQDRNMELPNLIGAMSAIGYGYTLLNIGQLTVYQLYDQFSRMNVNVQMDIYATRWAAWGKDDFDVAMWFQNHKKEG